MKQLILISLISAAIVGCGGGGEDAGREADAASVPVVLEIIPSLGKLQDGNVTVSRADGSVIATTTIIDGVARISAKMGCAPALVEVRGGHFYDEGTDRLVAMGEVPLRAITSCFSTQGRIAVTPLTEFAFRRLGTARDAPAIDAANAYIKSRYAPEQFSILVPPTVIASKSHARELGAKGQSQADIYALRLATLSVMASGNSKSLMTLVAEGGNNIAQTGAIDGASAQSFDAATFGLDYINALDTYTATVATKMRSFYHLAALALPDPELLKTRDVAQLMHLLLAVPAGSGVILVTDSSSSVLNSRTSYFGCDSVPGSDGVTVYKDCNISLRTLTKYSPCYGIDFQDSGNCYSTQKLGTTYSSDVKVSGKAAVSALPNNNGYRYSQRVTWDLTFASNEKQLQVLLDGQNMSAYFGDFPGTLPPVWPVGVSQCNKLDNRNASITIGSGADAFALTEVDTCIYDDFSVRPGNATLDSVYAVRGMTASGRRFSNAATPLVLRRPGVFNDNRSNAAPLLVRGKLELPTSAERTISLEPGDASGTTALLTLTIRLGNSVKVETARVSMARLLRTAIY